MRTTAWESISHGADSIGWFVYNAFWWVLPGTQAWDEVGRMGREVLEPLTPTLYTMRNTRQSIALMYCYSQEAVDGLYSLCPPDKNDPWNSVILWRTMHGTQEAYEVMSYAHLPFNVISEIHLSSDKVLPWKAIVIPYVEHLRPSSRKALARYMAAGGVVYVGADSTLDLPGIKKLPFAFDVMMNTWWPRDKPGEWNQRRSRAYTIGSSLLKARQLREVLAPLCARQMVNVSDPEVVGNIREAGDAKYIFLVNDHQINPTTPELRKKNGRSTITSP